MRNNLRNLIASLCFLSTLSAVGISADSRASLFRPGAVRVLIFSGRNNHDWRTTTPFLRKLLVDTGRFDVRICEEPAGTTTETLAVYDVLVLDYCGPRWGAVTERAVEEFVGSGKGMVVVHGASYAFSGLEVLGDHHVGTGIKEPPWPQYARMVGGHWPGIPTKRFHGERRSFPVKIVQPEHPIFQGMKESFIATDELYHEMQFLPDTQILAKAYDDPNLGGTSKEEPILCAVNYGKGRVFYTALGHEVPAMSEPGFKTTFVRGTEWAATAKVTLPVDLGYPTTHKDAIKVLVVTGGHDYETSFYTVFEDHQDPAWTHSTSSQPAFNSDIRQQYDVLVLYDFTQELDENGRKNLRNFVESGKGVVVLHHAIADYNSWPWWYQEVVGGRYLLEPDGATPASTYKHDEELFVRPVGQHPITSSIGPMHFWDETYKGLWISPEAQILLRTNNPTSDGPVAWVSPYSKPRVVYIQLGHGASAHQHPAYRALVKNAILWSAGGLR